MNKKTLKMALFLLIETVFFIFLISSVLALGIAPGRTTLDFEAGLKKSVEVTVINSEHKDMNLQVYAQGELGSYIDVHQNSFKMSSKEETVQLTYEINLPDSLSPGLHKAEVVVLQLPENTGGGRASLGAALAVATQIYVYVPYPGKYVQAELKVMGTETKKKFVIPVINQGQEEINDVHAQISIFDVNGKEVKKLDTDKVSLKPTELKEITLEWDVDIVKGKYIAKAVLNYDGSEILLETNFEVGELVLDLQQIFVKDFKLGEIAKFNAVVQNKWNEPIQNAYAEMRVYDKSMNELADVKSATYTIPAGMQTTMNYYWDTKDISEGLYNANIILYYLDKKTQQDLKLQVKQDGIDVIGLGYVISGEESSSGSLVKILLIVIGFLVLLNLLWFLVLRKYISRKKHSSK